MQPDYTPYLDDTLARTLGNTPYVADAKEAARAAAEKAYMAAVKSHTTPFYQEFGLPLGKGVLSGMKQRIKGMYMMKHQMPIPKAVLYAKMTRNLKKMGATKSQRATYKMKRDAEFAALSPEAQAIFLAREAKKKAAAKAYRKRVKRMLKADASKPTEGTGIESKLIKYKALAKAGDPVAIAKYNSYKRLINGGLLQARGGLINARPAGGMTSGRGCKARGGIIGVAGLASAAAPLILEGIKWIGKRIGERRAKRAAGSGMSDGIWLDDLVEEAGDKPPKNASSFWRRVYKIASKRLPMHFKNRKAAQEAVDEFMILHARTFFEEFRDKVLAKRTEKKTPLTMADTLEPVVVATAEKEGVPTSEASEILALPELQQPAGEGFMDTLMNIVKSPITKQLVSEGAKRLMPVISKKVTNFAKGRLTNAMSKSPALSKVVATTRSLADAAKPMLSEIINASQPEPIVETAPTSATMTENASSTNTLADAVPLPVIATASGLGPASADAFTRGGRMATRVYGMAKKTP